MIVNIDENKCILEVIKYNDKTIFNFHNPI